MSAGLFHDELMDHQWLEVMRSKRSDEKIAMVLESHETMRLMLTAHFQNLHPEWNDVALAAAVARRMLGETS